MVSVVSTAQVQKGKSYYGLGKKIIDIEDSEKVVSGSNYYADFGIRHLLEIAKNPQYENAFEPGTGRGFYFVGVMSLPNMKFGRAVDLNPRAVNLTKKNLWRNNIEKPVDVQVQDCFEYMKKDFRTDLIMVDLPLIPVPKDEKLPYGLRRIVDGGPSGNRNLKKIINNSPYHLNENGSLFFVTSDFINHDIFDLMTENNLEPHLMGRKKKHLDETKLTSKLRSHIEEHLDYRFKKDNKGLYFLLEAVKGVYKP
ncbi:MAG: hypothetical protein ACQER9_00135 [Nanobdellota archaeon]